MVRTARSAAASLTPAASPTATSNSCAVDLGEGNDRLLVETTHGGVTIVNANRGNDAIQGRDGRRPVDEQRQ